MNIKKYFLRILAALPAKNPSTSIFRKRITLPPYKVLLLHVNTLVLCLKLTLIASLDLNELVSVYTSMTKEELATAIFKSFL